MCSLDHLLIDCMTFPTTYLESLNHSSIINNRVTAWLCTSLPFSQANDSSTSAFERVLA
jgi:hypothetical protein